MREYPSVQICVIEAAQQGDADAFAEIYRVFYKFILKYAANCLREPLSVGNAYREQRMGTDLSGAEDITQETFLAAYQNLHRFDAARRLAPWLCTIALYKCINRINQRPKGERSLNRLGNDVEAFEMERMVELTDLRAFCNPGRMVNSAEIHEHVQSSLATLSQRRREVLSLRFFEDFSCEDIAAEMNLSKNVVKNELRRGVLQMRKALETVR